MTTTENLVVQGEASESDEDEVRSITQTKFRGFGFDWEVSRIPPITDTVLRLSTVRLPNLMKVKLYSF